MKHWRFIVAGVVLGGAIAAVAAWGLTSHITLAVQPRGIMGTETELMVVVRAYQRPRGEQALKAAEAALRAIDARMSNYLDSSEISRLNGAAPGELVKLSPQTLEVLGEARRFADQTDGAFDVTCRPLLLLWRQAGKEGRLPTDDELRNALALTGWKHFELTDEGAIKRTVGAAIDLGGIAKKYAIDLAARAMADLGVAGGLVNVGGDIRCFGRRGDGGQWAIGVRDPFDRDRQQERLLATVRLREGSVCTSGNYERFVEIGGKRYSHIVDPRTGAPADLVPSVTVIGADATRAGLWATALSVLGTAGLPRMPADLEAMIVTGTPRDFRIVMTPGFSRFLSEAPRLAAVAATASSPASRPQE